MMRNRSFLQRLKKSKRVDDDVEDPEVPEEDTTKPNYIKTKTFVETADFQSGHSEKTNKKFLSSP